VELSDLITYVSTQLIEASKGVPARGGPVMTFDQCTLEMTVTVAKDANAGIKVYVVTLGGEVSKAETHTITTTFKALPDVRMVASAL
jgi:hypothetical protein